MKFTPRDGTIRLYDGTAIPNYLELKTDNADINHPMGQPRQEEVLVLFRGLMDAKAHYVKGSDEKLMGAVPITLSATLDDTTDTRYLLEWLKGMSDAGATTVNAKTLVSTKVDTKRDGTNFNPAFADANKFTSNIEYFLNTSGTDVLFQINEIYLPLEEQSIVESADGVNINLSGQCYGTIVYTPAGSFTAGTDVTA